MPRRRREGVARRQAKPWSEYFPRVTNGEWRALYGAGLSSPVQWEIVVYLLTQTRGTGKMMSRELDGYDDWAEARETYGREAAPLFQGQIAAAIGRHERTVRRELHRLMDRGIVVEHEPGRKGKPAVLSVRLFPGESARESRAPSEDSRAHRSGEARDSRAHRPGETALSRANRPGMLREIETYKNETAEPRRATRTVQPAKVPPDAELTELQRRAARTLTRRIAERTP